MQSIRRKLTAPLAGDGLKGHARVADVRHLWHRRARRAAAERSDDREGRGGGRKGENTESVQHRDLEASGVASEASGPARPVSVGVDRCWL